MSKERRRCIPPWLPTRFLQSCFGPPQAIRVDMGPYIKPPPEPHPKQESPEETRRRIHAAMVRNPIKTGVCKTLFLNPGCIFGLCREEIGRQLEELKKAQAVEVIETRLYLTPAAQEIAQKIFGSSLRK